MVFIAGDGTIKHVHANAVPLSTEAVPSQFPVRAVLEINGGSARLLGIKPGDKVSLTVNRGGNQTTISASLGERPAG
jgi:uncharacterized membrane protein (UPF0127 family)